MGANLRLGAFSNKYGNKTCLVLWIFCKVAFESTTETTSTSTFKQIKSFPLRGIDVSASWISFNWLRPRLSAHFMNQAISRSGLRKCDELPAKIMFFDLWMSQFSASWNGLVTNRSAVSDSSCLVCRNYCLSNVTFTWGENLHPVISMLSHSISSSGADPGSLSITKMSCTSCLAQYKSKAYFCASFVLPLASRKLS